MIGLLAGVYIPSDEGMSNVYQSTVLQTSQVTRHTSKFISFISLLHWPPRKSAMMFDHIYGVASLIVMLVALLCLFKMYLALTATCREHRAFLLERAKQWLFWQLPLKCISGARTEDKNSQYYSCFLFFSNFYSIMRFKENHYLTREFHVKLHLKTDIALIASRFVRYRFSRAI